MPLPISRANMGRAPLLALALFALLTSLAACGSDSGDSQAISAKITPADSSNGVSPPPPSLADLQSESVPATDDNDSSVKANNANTLGLQIRADAMREAALSYGARGGLAERTFEIQRRLADYVAILS